MATGVQKLLHPAHTSRSSARKTQSFVQYTQVFDIVIEKRDYDIKSSIVMQEDHELWAHLCRTCEQGKMCLPHSGVIIHKRGLLVSAKKLLSSLLEIGIDFNSIAPPPFKPFAPPLICHAYSMLLNLTLENKRLKSGKKIK